jgi:hypothetical protein
MLRREVHTRSDAIGKNRMYTYIRVGTCGMWMCVCAGQPSLVSIMLRSLLALGSCPSASHHAVSAELDSFITAFLSSGHENVCSQT